LVVDLQHLCTIENRGADCENLPVPVETIKNAMKYLYVMFMLLSAFIARANMDLPMIILLGEEHQVCSRYALDLSALNERGVDIYTIEANWDLLGDGSIRNLKIRCAGDEAAARRILIPFTSGVKIPLCPDKKKSTYIQLHIIRSPLGDKDAIPTSDVAVKNLAMIGCPNISRSRFLAESVFDVYIDRNSKINAISLVSTTSREYAINAAAALSIAVYKVNAMPANEKGYVTRLRVKNHFTDDGDESSLVENLPFTEAAKFSNQVLR
jgi:hypothetical protein